MDEIGGHSVGQVPLHFPTELKNMLVQRTQEQARLGPALAQPSLAQAGTLPKPAQARTQHRPDHMNLTHFFQKYGLHALRLNQASELRSGCANTTKLFRFSIRV